MQHVRKGTEIEVKRFYMPGVILSSKCPKCGENVEIDMDDEYISYPQVGENVVEFYHECNEEDGLTEEWDVEFNLSISVVERLINMSNDRFEYMVLYQNNVSDNILRPNYDDFDVKEFNKLGKDRWELVAVLGSECAVAYFKRKLSE